MIKQTINVLNGLENSALSYLPDRLAADARKQAALYGGMINEIRLRSGGVMSLTIRGENITCKTLVTENECHESYMKLCKKSPYSFADSLKNGYITTSEGIRAGICGKAVCENNTVTAISDITSICIRIPRRIPGAGDVAAEILHEMGNSKGIIIWSVPGMGKTTVLRELALRLSNGCDPLRVAVVDTRHEICAGIGDCGLIDILDGYPRSKGIEIAKRTMSPQIIICDEIATADDASAIFDAAGSGIPIAASAHAGSRGELCSQSHLKELLCSGHIGALIGLLEQKNGGYRYEVYRCFSDTELYFER